MKTIFFCFFFALHHPISDSPFSFLNFFFFFSAVAWMEGWGGGGGWVGGWVFFSFSFWVFVGF